MTPKLTCFESRPKYQQGLPYDFDFALSSNDFECDKLPWK